MHGTAADQLFLRLDRAELFRRTAQDACRGQRNGLPVHAYTEERPEEEKKAQATGWKAGMGF